MFTSFTRKTHVIFSLLNKKEERKHAQMKIHTQLQLRLPQPTIYGPKDYRIFREILSNIDRILTESGMEDKLMISYFEEKGINDPTKYQYEHLQRCFRCGLLKILCELDYREFSVRLADSCLYQWFTGYNTLGISNTPSKSTLERYCKMFSPETLNHVSIELLKTISLPEQSTKLLYREEPVLVKDVFADSTCLKANIHFPVDWVLLRDGVRSLVKAISCIRKQGLKHRICDPVIFFNNINSLSIAMTSCRRKKDSNKHRKEILRKMKKLSKTVRDHGQRYRDLLDLQWASTSWSRPQTEQVLKRIDNVLEKLPAAIKQAHERIIGERKIPSGEKILSLYDEHAHVIVRGKSGAEVEFGNGVYLAEQIDGLIVDWDIFEDQPLSDSKIVAGSVKRIANNFGEFSSYTTDRGFSSSQNNILLEKMNIFNAICPKSPKDLSVRLTDESFVKLQKRRAQTEGRIGIFKNVFLGKPMRSQNFEVKKITVAWSVLTHNLWVMARIAMSEKEKEDPLYLRKAA